MKAIILLFLIALPILLFNQDNRYIIYEDFRFGFIDGEGEVAIKPRFRNVGHFSEGLAQAREEAYWGFIDTSGHWAIDPQYDYVQGFNYGFAEVWRNDTVILISQDGKEWARSKRTFRKLADKYYVIAQDDQKCILMNETCWLTLPREVTPVGLMGRYIKLRKAGDWPWKYGLIDTTGAVIIPFGRYDDIHPYYNGVALASRYDSSRSSSDYFFVNTKGEVVRQLNLLGLHKASISYSHDGRLFNVSYQDKEGRFHENLMNLEEELLLEVDTSINIYPLGYGLAAIKNWRNKEWVLVNEQGRCCTKTPLTRLLMQSGPWRAGYLYGQEANQWVRFDTNGIRQEVPGLAILDTTAGARLYRFWGNKLATFGIEQRGKGSKQGLLHVTQGMILPPVYDALVPLANETDQAFSKENLMVAVIKGEEVQYLTVGRSLETSTSWQHKVLPKGALLPYDTDSPVPMTYRMRKPLKMPWWLRLFTGKAKLFRSRFAKTPFMKQYEGRRLFLLNDSPDTLIFSAYNMGQLSIHLEAQDEKGKWRRVDYCKGCDVHSNAIQHLPPGHYLSFSVPKMAGARPTKFRYVATYWTPKAARQPKFVERADGRRYLHKYPLDVEEGKKLYSRTFKGGINPAQFQRRQSQRRAPPFIQKWVMGK